MYSVLPSFILGFHGCDQSIAERVLAGNASLKPSNNKYDWLGNGVYFWENNPQRAEEFAEIAKNNPKISKGEIKQPAVIGAVIDLGHCLNLLDSKNLELIKESYRLLKEVSNKNPQITLPQNKNIGSGRDFPLRHLDCAVVELTHYLQDRRANRGETKYEFDSVRGMFVEGDRIYQGAGFNQKNHIQICVRNPNCIKGYFRVLDSVDTHNIP